MKIFLALNVHEEVDLLSLPVVDIQDMSEVGLNTSLRTIWLMISEVLQGKLRATSMNG